MGLFGRKKREDRADGIVQVEDSLLKAMLGGGTITRETALQVPTVSGGIDLIADIVAGTPIKLYRDNGGKVEEVRGDPRVRLLNDETGDTLNASEFWKAIVRDYYLGKGGYAYIHKEKGEFKSLHYVDEAQIAIQKNSDPIFKDFDILVQGQRYRPFDFLKILRNTRDGASGTPITIESSKLIEVAYQTLCFESYLVKKGGNKKGFLKSKNKLTDEAMAALKTSYSNLYSNNSDNVVVLNSGIDFQESSNTAAEMQINENKLSNAEEFAKLFHVSTGVMSGNASDKDISSLARLAAIPLMTTIQCALNKDFLLEKEKGTYYWAFDTKELLKGDMKERFDAYKTALDANFMQIDEVRYAEDMEPLGLSWIRLGLQDVLYDPNTKTIYTPNTNQTSVMGEETAENNLKTNGGYATIGGEQRAYIQKPNGKMNGSTKGGAKSGKTKYSPSPQRGKPKIQLSPKTYAKLCGVFGTQYPDLRKDEIRQIKYNKRVYTVKSDGYGGFETLKVEKLR